MLAILVLVLVTILHVTSAAGHSCRNCLSDSMADKYADMDNFYKLRDQFTQDPNPYDKPAPYT
jgi:hypothetical protein